jgi:predicted phosphodiesterase
MRIAILSDIHGNLVALEAVLADLDAERIDQIVCLGDVATFGPRPREVIAQLRGLNCPIVMGNMDAWVLNPRPHEVRDENSQRITEVEFWSARQLSPADLDYLRTFRPTVEVALGDETTLLCFHGSPQSNTDAIVSTTPEEELERMLSGFSATVMAGGHTHVQILRRHRDLIFINPGSVGLPFERARHTDQVRNPPRAEYGLVSWENGSLNIELRRVPFDVDVMIQAARDSGMPHLAWWVKNWSKG